jgi:hypothetical protein
MKSLIILAPALLLSGCLTFGTTAPVRHKFPDVPAELLKSCPDLQLAKETDKLSDVLKIVNDNYARYHECRVSVDTWIEWYKTQKQIYDK